MSASPGRPISARCDSRFTASRSSGNRDAAAVKWIVIHDEEATSAISAARFFADKRLPDAGGPAGSAHLCVDDTICFRTLPNDAIAWAARSCFEANLHGFHIELAGLARWSMAVWESHRQTLRRAAYKTALHCLAFDVPLRFVFAADLPSLAGVTTHAEITKASKRLDPKHAGRYSHTDPGAFFPRRLFMGYVRDYHAQLPA